MNVRRGLVVLAFLFVGISVRAQESEAGIVIGRAAVQFANGNRDSAEVLYRQALAANPRNPMAAVGLARILLLKDSTDAGKRMFEQADSWDRKKGYKQFGEGLIYLQRGQRDRAKSRFQEAFRKNPRFADALVEVARIQAQGLVDRYSAKRTYRRALEVAPDNPVANYELARLQEDGGDLDEAIRSYEAQARVNPEYSQTMMRLGYALLDKQQFWHARQRLFEALQNTVGDEGELSLALAATYMGDRQFALASEAYAQALGLLPDDERALYEDVRLVAGPQEGDYLQRISGEQKMIFLRKFWLRRDPTPVTPVNERLLEHFRRVWYAKRNFSRGKQPWDARGEVYIRYGEPDQRATSRNPNFSTDHNVDMVRERYMNAIYGTNPPQSLQRGVLPVFPVVDPVQMLSSGFESGQPTQSTSTTGNQYGDTGETGDNGSDQAAASAVTTTQQATAQAPTFSAMAQAQLVRWEEWTYTGVLNGLNLTFVDRIGRGDFQFATPPPTSNMNMASVMQQYAPEEQLTIASIQVPDQYEYDTRHAPLDFYYYNAQFRAPERNRTEVDIYYGLPTADLQFSAQENGTYKASIQAGFAVFDTLWNVQGRFQDKIDLVSPSRPRQERGSMHIDGRSMVIDGGQRVLLSVQAEDLGSGRLQAYRENISITQFDSTTLSMSDIVVAGSVRPADSTDAPKFVRNGLFMLPMASRSFKRGQAIQVYFEIYNLRRGADYGDTEYEVEHAFRTGGGDGGSILGSVGRILGGSARRVGVARVMEGFRGSEYQHFQIATTGMGTGTYTLIITVRDLKSNQRVTRERIVRIGD
jgi:GWxTD domain-containing protein